MIHNQVAKLVASSRIVVVRSATRQLAREGGDLDALAAGRQRRVVGAEEAVGGDEREQDVAEDGAEGDAHRRPGLPAESPEHAARLAPRHLLVAVVRQVQQLRRRRTGRQDQVREHLHPSIRYE